MPAPSLRIAYVSLHDPGNLRAFSGIAHYAFEALKAHVGRTTALTPPPLPSALVARAGGAAAYLFEGWRALRPEDFDVAFVLQAPVVGAFIPRRIPVVFSTDNTWAAYEGYYPQVYRRGWQRAVRYGVDRRALRRADLLLLSSDWAAGSAARDYGVPAERIEVLPYGANLAVTPAPRASSAWALEREVQLLLLGVSWERKGGALALEAVTWLNQQGVAAHLTVCGCTPPAGTRLPPCVTLLPFLDKGAPADAERLHQLMLRSHFLLLPTRAECMGLVFCEAGAYGLPVITTHTGGVPSVVEEGVNGHTLPLEATGEDFGRAVAGAWQDREAYVRFSRRARERFEARLNWAAWGRGVQQALQRHFPQLARGEARA
ncbi:glycosyltransferase family 4 protein [Aggregicoccus sp. 17bor-14]|uniref:glycosyltransferase family 4 protein n=1 Tax=Myxococcaceae TaxID=31 RepID=UPI00129CC802|nr:MULTISPECIES: glycosyltransferase family 4 protein [Myxococcaceae]MBF5043763.1 glycosyltransferase family 4 protein [Simulacricoccus sp. 17bor-14]MRI89517.1 glycosyltransferase family 4 protein [Aggregicoccus sp. 17bor-14]